MLCAKSLESNRINGKLDIFFFAKLEPTKEMLQQQSHLEGVRLRNTALTRHLGEFRELQQTSAATATSILLEHSLNKNTFLNNFLPP